MQENPAKHYIQTTTTSKHFFCPKSAIEILEKGVKYVER